MYVDMVCLLHAFLYIHQTTVLRLQENHTEISITFQPLEEDQ